VPIAIYSDSNPFTYLTSNATKSAKLTRWSLALQGYNYSFRYRRGSLNIVPDLLSRPCGEVEYPGGIELVCRVCPNVSMKVSVMFTNHLV